MNFIKGQQKEIKTIKERTIKLKLSDADCERISKKAGKCGISVGILLENFIGDLVGGTYTNGSDECSFADDWFERCWFSTPKETLLKHLLEQDDDVEDFLIAYDEVKYYESNPEEFSDDLEEAKENGEEMLWFEKDYHDYTDEFFSNHEDVDIEKEIELCRKWLTELQSIKGIANP